MKTSQSTVFIVDDDEIVRKSLAWLLESVHIDCQLYANGEDFLENYEPLVAGCVVMDVRMPRADGLEVQRRLQQVDSNIPVIIVTAHADVPMATKVLRAGAFDLIEKPYNDNQLLDRIHAAIDLHRQRLSDKREKQKAAEVLQSLTPRELEVFKHVFDGKTNREIAESFQISIKTVELHRSNLMKKLGGRGTADLVRTAADLGLLNPVTDLDSNH